MPLDPTIAGSNSELPTRGIIAMAVNGVPAYGPQEASSTNAVEPDPGSQIQDAQFWYGHAGKRFSFFSSCCFAFFSPSFYCFIFASSFAHMDHPTIYLLLSTIIN